MTATFVALSFGHDGHMLTVVLSGADVVVLTDQYRTDSYEFGPRIARHLAVMGALEMSR